ncbi:MAG: universal stress protein [Weeksellaceae bacterium]|jgi:nucleotide-binding universal stress UspA family protein|nr:universal stress protein [Weeksellaceae bacterium]MDX9704988.1 universal stress protein [Weeksellaceae bacterium]
MKKVLVTLDFKGNDSQLIETAKEWGRAFEAEIILLNVDPIEIDAKTVENDPIMAHRMESIKNLTYENIQNVEGKLGGEIFRFKHVLKTGSPHEQILNAAEEENVDLIIMGSNKHSAAYRFLIGSVADHVVKKSTIPVLLVPFN